MLLAWCVVSEDLANLGKAKNDVNETKMKPLRNIIWNVQICFIDKVHAFVNVSGGNVHWHVKIKDSGTRRTYVSWGYRGKSTILKSLHPIILRSINLHFALMGPFYTYGDYLE